MNSEQHREIIFLQRKGGIVMLNKGYQYYKLKDYKNGSQLWRCSLYKKIKCTGNIVVKGIEICKTKQHDPLCRPDINKNLLHTEIAALKEEVICSDEPIPKLYEKTITKMKNTGLDLVANLPVLDSIKHSLYNARNQAEGIKKTVFNNFKEVEIPSKFSSFVLAEFYNGESCILVFCSQKARQLIGSVKEFFADGTFKSCPRPFYQLYIIYGEFRSSADATNVIPLIFALLPDKKQNTYFHLFDLIKSQLPMWNPQIFHIDFELGAMNALVIFFPNLKIVGCYYHWANSIWKKVKQWNLKSKPQRRIVALTAVLPLLPEEFITEGWQYIINECDLYNVPMSKFKNYIQRFWFKADFYKTLSVFGQHHRINNVTEGFNAKLNRALNKNTVTLLRLLNFLETNVSVTHAYKIPTKRRKLQKENDNYIQSIQMQLINKEITVESALDKLRN